MDFWSQFWPQLIATIIGIGIGIPVALWISRFQEKKTEEEKKKKILEALYEELVENNGYLRKWNGDNIELKIKGTIELSALLKDDLWRASCDGGGRYSGLKIPMFYLTCRQVIARFTVSNI